MKSFVRIAGVSAALFLLCACNSMPKVDMPELPSFGEKKPTRPAWIDNPGNGVSASANVHIKGRIAQEELATQRAREEYAKRFGVTVEASQVIGMTVTNDRANTAVAKTAREELKQTDVKAQVKAKWRDPETDVFYVWLVPAGH